MTGGKKQVKITTDESIICTFKEACAKNSQSMAEVLTEFMAGYAQKTISKSENDYQTRRKRRKAIQAIAKELTQIRDYEEQYRDRIPENLQGSSIYDRADETVNLLEEVIEQISTI